MSEELELSGKSENTAPAESAAEPAAEPSPAPAPVQRVSAHNTAAAAALHAAAMCWSICLLFLQLRIFFIIRIFRRKKSIKKEKKN